MYLDAARAPRPWLLKMHGRGRPCHRLVNSSSQRSLCHAESSPNSSHNQNPDNSLHYDPAHTARSPSPASFSSDPSHALPTVRDTFHIPPPPTRSSRCAAPTQILRPFQTHSYDTSGTP